MKHIHSLNPVLCVVALLTFFTTFTLRAQFGNDLIVGDFESDQTTNFTSGTHTYDNTYVGRGEPATNNTLGVYNAGTLLSLRPDFGGFFYVGDGGSGNTLVISNGGTLGAAGNGYIGFFSDDNTALVTGSGSLLTIGDPSDPFSFGGNFYVGSSSSGNSLIISGGGTVSAFQSNIGEGASTNNTALVTGAGSLWTNVFGLAVGAGGSGHSLVISNGGTVATDGAWVGANSANNTALVTGAGSLWTNSNFLALGLGDGNDNSSNSLVISNGGSVATLSVSVGSGPTSSNNTVLVTDGGTWTNSSIFTIGREGRGNSLVISNGGRVQNNAGVIGDFTNSLNNSVLVTGAASTWTNSGALTIAQRGSGTLTVASGGSVASSGITIASSNTATGTLNVGRFGTNDTGGTIIAPTIAFGAGTGAINFNQSDAVTITSAISGAGTINQLGDGTTVLSGGSANTYSGTTTVSGGTLKLNKTTGVDAIAGAVVVNSGAILLLSSSDNVKDTAAVTLSGGTITRSSGVSETFGALDITGSGILDFGTGATGNLTFGTYQSNAATPSAFLTLNNFIPGNAFTFASTSFSTNSVGDYFTFGTGYVNSSITDNGSGSFTITAIPEPSTYVAAITLLAMMLWPLCRRLRGKVS
jgi:fibronectin-binding autotransporter adhesin